MSLQRRTAPLKQIAERLGLATLPNLIAKPGTNEVVRLTVQYHDGRSPDSVATLIRGHGSACQLLVHYLKSPKPIDYNFEIPLERFQKILSILRQSKFDAMDDEEDLPYLGADFWLVERASGTFHHDVMLCPESAKGHHRELVLGFRSHLSESVRQLAI